MDSFQRQVLSNKSSSATACNALFPHLYPTPHLMLHQHNRPLLRAKHYKKDASYLDAKFDRIFTSFAIHWMEGLVRLASSPRAIVLDKNEKDANADLQKKMYARMLYCTLGDVILI